MKTHRSVVVEGESARLLTDFLRIPLTETAQRRQNCNIDISNLNSFGQPMLDCLKNKNIPWSEPRVLRGQLVRWLPPRIRHDEWLSINFRNLYPRVDEH